MFLLATLAHSGARALAVEGDRPTLVNAGATIITEQGAELDAQINPGNSETTYEFWLECQHAPGYPCEPTAPLEQAAHIAAGSG